MESITEALDLLSWSTKTVNQVRRLLAELNVPLSAVLAQMLALIVLGLVGWFLLSPARRRERTLARLSARVGLVAAAVAMTAIVAAWVDHLLVPRSHEIVGRVTAPQISGLHVDLLDYRGESLGPRVQSDSTGAFVVTYTPEFADPPGALLVSLDGCQDRRQPLRRAHLLGAELTVKMSCGGDGG